MIVDQSLYSGQCSGETCVPNNTGSLIPFFRGLYFNKGRLYLSVLTLEEMIQLEGKQQAESGLSFHCGGRKAKKAIFTVKKTKNTSLGANWAAFIVLILQGK